MKTFIQYSMVMALVSATIYVTDAPVNKETIVKELRQKLNDPNLEWASEIIALVKVHPFLQTEPLDNQGNYLIHKAVQNGKLNLVTTFTNTFGIESLLKQNNNGDTPFHVALEAYVDAKKKVDVGSPDLLFKQKIKNLPQIFTSLWFDLRKRQDSFEQLQELKNKNNETILFLVERDLLNDTNVDVQKFIDSLYGIDDLYQNVEMPLWDHNYKELKQVFDVISDFQKQRLANYVDSDKETLLHKLARAARPEGIQDYINIAMLLLDIGINPNAKNSNDETAVVILEKENNTDFKELIELIKNHKKIKIDPLYNNLRELAQGMGIVALVLK